MPNGAAGAAGVPGAAETDGDRVHFFEVVHVTQHQTIEQLRERARAHRVARTVLLAFLATFVAARLLVYAMASGWFPDIHISVGETHVHHLSLGILILAAVGAVLLLFHPPAGGRRIVSVLYGIGLALTFDEFAMWIHLDDVYWQRASFDAVVVIAAALGIVAAGPSLKRFRPRHWKAAVGLALAGVLLFVVLKPLWSAGRDFGAHFR